jgi:hypothetical protein
MRSQAAPTDSLATLLRMVYRAAQRLPNFRYGDTRYPQPARSVPLDHFPEEF